MTVKRSQRSPEDILFELIGLYPGKAEAVANRMSINVKALYKKLNSNDPDRSLNLNEFSALVSILEEAGIDASEALQALMFRHNRVCINVGSIDEVTDEDLRKNGMQALHQFGEFSGELEKALDDGVITESEIDQLEPKKRRLIATLAMLWHRIHERHKRDVLKRRFGFLHRKQNEAEKVAA